MEAIIESLELFLEGFVSIAAILVEMVGIFILTVSVVKAIISWFKHKTFGECLENGTTQALEIMMCGEILKTAIANETSDYLALVWIIGIRAALAVELHWERKNKLAELAAERISSTEHKEID